MDRLDELRVLTEVIASGSMAGAARRLGVSPASVTRAIANLEKKVMRTLFQRTTRHLIATDAALELDATARRILADYASSMEGSTEKGLHGLIRITAPMQFGRRCVAPALYEFIAQNPDVKVDLVLSDQNLDLREERIDLAVRIGQLRDSDLRMTRLGAVSRVLVASPTYLANRNGPAHPHDLADHDIVFGTSRPTPREWQFGVKPLVRVRLEPKLCVNDIETQKQAVHAGVGIGRFLSYQVAEDMRAGRLIRLLPEFEPPALPVQIVHLPSSYETRLITECRDFIRSEVRTVLAADNALTGT